MQNPKQSSSLFIKKQQFHSAIRRKQLDQYRQKKRLQLFNNSIANHSLHSTNNNNENYQNQNQIRQEINLQQSIKFFRFPFDRNIQEFMVKNYQNTLYQQKYNLQSLAHILNHLVNHDLISLCDCREQKLNLLNRVCKILYKSLKSIDSIPNNSLIRIQNFNKIESILYMIFECFKKIIHGIIRQQNHIIQQIKINKKRKTILNRQYLKIMGMNNNKQMLQRYNRQVQNVLYFEQNQIIHPLEVCIDQILSSLQLFLQNYITQDKKISRKCQQTGQQANQNDKNILCTYQKYWYELWYLMSFFQSNLFSQKLLECYIDQIKSKSMNQTMTSIVDVIMETLCNFVLNQNQINSHNQSDNRNQQKFIVQYSTQKIYTILVICLQFMKNYELGDTSYNSLLKIIKQQLKVRKEGFILILQQKNVIQSLIGIIFQQNQLQKQLYQNWSKKNITTEQYRRQYEQKSRINMNIKSQIIQTLGYVFGSLGSSSKYVKKPTLISEIVSVIIHQIKTLNQWSQNPILDVQLQQQIVAYSTFALFNLCAISQQLTCKFIQQNILAYLLKLWGYCNNKKINTKSQDRHPNSVNRLKDIWQIEQHIICTLTNMIIQLTSESDSKSNLNIDEQRISDILLILIQFKSSGVIKLLIEYLKQVTNSLGEAMVNKQMVLYSLRCLKMMMKMILNAGYEQLFIENLQGSSNLDCLYSSLNIIMMSQDNMLQQKITIQAQRCLQLFDIIVKQNNYQRNFQSNNRRQNQIEQYQQQYSNNYYNSNDDKQIQI